MLNLNKATKNDLKKIDGVGEVLARKIINYREKNNGFKELANLKQIRGVGESKFSKLKGKIVIKDLGLTKIEFDPKEYNLFKLREVHLVGDMNNWDPTDKTYSLNKENEIWVNYFDLEEGTEYKIMYDSNSWEEEKYIGAENGKNFEV